MNSSHTGKQEQLVNFLVLLEQVAILEDPT